MALAIIVAPTATNHEHTLKPWKPVVGALLCAVLVVAWVGNVTFIVADNYFLRGQFPAAGEDAPKLLKTAIALDPFNDMYRSMLGQSYQNQMLSWLNQASTEQGEGKDPSTSITQARLSLQEAADSYRRTIALVPTEYDNYLFLSGLYNQAGNYLDPVYFKDALKAADEGMAVEPYGPGVRMQRALAQVSMGDAAGAAKTLDAAAPMDPNYVEIHVLYAQILVEAGRLSDALGQYKALQSKDTSNTTYADAIKSIEASLSSGGETTKAP
jgi:tetratricopeptide (TPR) repeat protein